MKSKILIIGCVSLFVSGCMTDDLARKDDVYIVRSQVNEQIIRIEDKLSMLSGEIDSLNKRLDSLEGKFRIIRSSIRAYNSDISKQKKEIEILNSKIESLKKDLESEFNKKMDLVIDEVVKENQKIAEKINALSKTTTYDVGSYHIVKRGETLSEIAAKYDVSIEDIMAANDIDNPDMLKVGQKLFIPQ